MRRELKDVQGEAWIVEAARPANAGEPYQLTFRQGEVVHRRDYQGGKEPTELTVDELQDLLHSVA